MTGTLFAIFMYDVSVCCVAKNQEDLDNLLSAFYHFNVNGVDAISMDSVHVSVRIQLQTEDPFRNTERGRGLYHWMLQ